MELLRCRCSHLESGGVRSVFEADMQDAGPKQVLLAWLHDPDPLLQIVLRPIHR